MRFIPFFGSLLLLSTICFFSSTGAFATELQDHAYFDDAQKLCIDSTSRGQIPSNIDTKGRYISLSECRKDHPELLLKRAAGILLWPAHMLLFAIFSFIVVRTTTKRTMQYYWNVFFSLHLLFAVWIFFLYSTHLFFSNGTFDDFFIQRHEALRSLYIMLSLLLLSSCILFARKYISIKYGKSR